MGKKEKKKRETCLSEILLAVGVGRRGSRGGGPALEGAELPPLLSIRERDAWGAWYPAGCVPEKKIWETKEVEKDAKAAVSFSPDYVCSLSDLKGKHLYFCRTA